MNNIKSLDPNHIKRDEKLCKNILIYHIYFMITNREKPFCLIISIANKYTEESKGNRWVDYVKTSNPALG